MELRRSDKIYLHEREHELTIRDIALRQLRSIVRRIYIVGFMPHAYDDLLRSNKEVTEYVEEIVELAPALNSTSEVLP